ncbi:MAG: hypothetical protein HC841_08020 [Verrucomicrobiae bacterium]|nr:hypothetical protein [Verrucomicrobiae bacterium]
MKNRILMGMVFALLGLILWLNLGRRDWLGPRSIQISLRSLPAPAAGAVSPLVFLFEREWSLTGIRVIAAADATNAAPPTLWDLVSTNGSAPVTYVHYGGSPAGMAPRYAGEAARPLIAGAAYVIELESGKLRGRREFTFQPVKPRG